MSKGLQKREPLTPARDLTDIVLQSRDRKPITLGDCFNALMLSEGRMAQAIHGLNVSMITFARLVDSTPALKEVVALHRELLLDEAEQTVRVAVRKGDSLVAMRVLQTAGKHRGWTDKDQLADSDRQIEISYVNDWRHEAQVVESEAIIELDEPLPLPEEIVAASDGLIKDITVEEVIKEA